MIAPTSLTSSSPAPLPPPPSTRLFSSSGSVPPLLAVGAGGPPAPAPPFSSSVLSTSPSAPLRASRGIADEPASILMELNGRPSDDTPPSLEPPTEQEDGRCQLSNCLLCSRGVPGLLIRSPTWASIMRVVFYCLQSDSTTKMFFNLKTDVYGFMTTHWTKLCLDKKRSDNWHKQIQDMLSHSKNLFESGMEKYRQNGFWRMKQTQDPWTIRKDKKSPKLPSKRINESSESIGSPKRRKTEDASDDESESDSEDHKSLEDEVRHLKEELKKKEQETIDSKLLYFKLAEQVKILQQQNELLLIATRKQQQHQHMPQQHQHPHQQQQQQQVQSQAPVQTPNIDPQRMNPKQWDASYPQLWEAPTPQQEAARKALMGGSAPGIPMGSPKWEEPNTLRFSTSMYPLHFNFPFSSPAAKMDDSSPLRLNPLASL